MPNFHLGAVNMPGKRIEGAFTINEFHLLLAKQWIIVHHNPIEAQPLSESPYIVYCWKIKIGKANLSVRLWNDYWGVRLGGALQPAAEFALWYFTLVPSDICLSFSPSKKESPCIDIDHDTRVEDIMANMYPPPKTTPSQRYTEALQSSYRLKITRTNKRRYNKILYLVERVQEGTPSAPTFETISEIMIRIMVENIPVYTEEKRIIQICEDQDVPWFPLEENR